MNMKVSSREHGDLHNLSVLYVSSILDCPSEEDIVKNRPEVRYKVSQLLLNVQSAIKLSRFVDSVIDNTIKEKREWDPGSAKIAFEYLEKYAINLYREPWKPEIQTIKLHIGALQVSVLPYVAGEGKIFEKMGYIESTHSHTFKLNKFPKRTDLADIAFDCFLAGVECVIISDIYNEVKRMGYSVSDVYDCRLLYTGRIKECSHWIQENCSPNEKIAKRFARIDEEQDENMDWESGKLNGETPKGKGKEIGIGARPKDYHRNRLGLDISSDRLAMDQSNYGQGIRSRGNGIDVENIVKRQHSEEISSGDLYGFSVVVERGYPVSAPKSEIRTPDNTIYQPGTLDDHLMKSALFLHTEDSTKSKFAKGSTNANDWVYVMDDLRKQYGDEYYEGQRGDPLNLQPSKPIPISSKKGATTRQRPKPSQQTILQTGGLHNISNGKPNSNAYPVNNLSDPYASGSLRYAHLAPITSTNKIHTEVVTDCPTSPVSTTSVHPLNMAAQTRCHSIPVNYDASNYQDRPLTTPKSMTTSRFPRNLPDLDPSISKQPYHSRLEKKTEIENRKSIYDNVTSENIKPETTDCYTGTENTAMQNTHISTHNMILHDSHVDSTKDTYIPQHKFLSLGSKAKIYPGYSKDIKLEHDKVNDAYIYPAYKTQTTNSNDNKDKKNSDLPSDKLTERQDALNEDKGWQCAHCTYHNAPDRNVCDICGKSQKRSREHGLVSGGSECTRCTVINKISAVKCEVCGEKLKGSPTYV